LRRTRFEGEKPKEDEDKLVESRNAKEGELGSSWKEFDSRDPSKKVRCRSRKRKDSFDGKAGEGSEDGREGRREGGEAEVGAEAGSDPRTTSLCKKVDSKRKEEEEEGRVRCGSWVGCKKT